MLFEITAEHINKLDDEQLRNLIGLLCESTFRKKILMQKGFLGVEIRMLQTVA